MLRRLRSMLGTDDLRADHLSNGAYARNQLFSPVRLIAWSHRQRFERALRLGERFAGLSVLDYGCGDGSLLAMIMAASNPPARGVGADAPSAIEDCKQRLGDLSGLSFIDIADLREDHDGMYDGIFCTEVLEHVVDPDSVLELLHRLLKPQGTLVISVPVETGPTVLVKQIVRRLAGWARIGDYRWTRAYAWRDLGRAVVSVTALQHMDRPVHDGPFGPAHDHTGFNWRALMARVTQRFELLTVESTPGPFPPGWGSQVWFVARRH